MDGNNLIFTCRVAVNGYACWSVKHLSSGLSCQFPYIDAKKLSINCGNRPYHLSLSVIGGLSDARRSLVVTLVSIISGKY